MGRTTTDPRDPGLRRESDTGSGQNEAYLVLSEEDRAKGFVRPYRDTYIHTMCNTRTKMGRPIAETYATNPSFYGATYCVKCRAHLPLSEFTWIDAQGRVTDIVVGS